MTKEQSISDIDDATAEAWKALFDEAMARGDIRLVVQDGVTMAYYMPRASRRAAERPPIDPNN